MAERIPEQISATERATICRRLHRLGTLLRLRTTGGTFGAPPELISISILAAQPDHRSRRGVSTAEFAEALEALERWCVENGHERRVAAARSPDWSRMRSGDYPDGVEVVLLPVDEPGSAS